jgi:putative oxidoreductase
VNDRQMNISERERALSERAFDERAITRWAIRYARVAIGAAFLSAVAGRFGLWSGALQWERFGRFITRTGDLNAWAPAAIVPILAWSATILETTFGLALILGLATRWVALGSAGLLAWFAMAMVVYDGVKAPLDYSVFSASAGALLLALAVDRDRRASSASSASSASPASS